MPPVGPNGRLAVLLTTILSASMVNTGCISPEADRPTASEAPVEVPPTATLPRSSSSDAVSFMTLASGSPPLTLRTGSNVSLVQARGSTWACRSPQACVEDYLALPQRLGSKRQGLSKASLERSLDAIKQGRVARAPDRISEGELRQRIVEATGADVLLAAARDTPLRVQEIAAWQQPGSTGRRLLMSDDLVGTWEAVLLLPEGEGPFPVVLANHGHVEDSDSYLSTYGGVGFPQAGYGILVSTQRVSWADRHEDAVARSLLSAGLSLMAVRIHETLRGLQFLRALQNVDSKRVALLGHSGSSLANMLAVRLTKHFAAHITDGIGEFNSWDNGLIADESLPGLFVHSSQLSDVTSMVTPSIEVGYGYPDGLSPLLAFLRETMTVSAIQGGGKRAKPVLQSTAPAAGSGGG